MTAQLPEASGTFGQKPTLTFPDAGANPFKLGPRVMISTAALPATGLDQPGTVSVTVARLRLAPGQPAAAVMARSPSRRA